MKTLKWLAGVGAAAYAAYVSTTWLGYGKPRKRPDEGLDAFMPEYDVCERHSIAVAAPPEVTLGVAKDLQLDSSRIVRAIFRGRELILRSKPDETVRPKGLLELTTSLGWGVLSATPGEIVIGAATKPWQPNPVFRTIAPADFAAFSEPDYVKIVWTLRADPRSDGGSTFRTETRAIATDAGARRKFRAYWAFFSPGIVLLRAMMLPAVKAAAERAWHVRGDDLLPGARAQFTHSVMIDAAPADVWPWLVQMGCQRAGWYSWDRLDNAGVKSAEVIIPALQHLAEGDVLPFRPVGDEGFKVLRIDPEHELVLASEAPDFHGTWAFVLEPVGNQTRLVTRYRAAYEPSTAMRVRLPMMAAL
ncbi:MAG TPA: hypothetical protein VLT45_11205, partial [Kofleriaceae bacterium]|nr:hypothetical protein [Kofleriaceae bacterium]